MSVKPRPYQAQGIIDLRAEFAAGIARVLYVLPTGGGKTFTYAHIAEGASARGKRVLILEHRKELIRQCSLSLARIGVKHQVVSPADKVAQIRAVHVARVGWPMVDPGAHIAVASVQTLARRMDWLEEFAPDLIVVDEAHHSTAGTWDRIIQACPRARLLGVTATPIEPRGEGLGKVYQSMILGPSMRELIADGYLLPPRVLAPPTVGQQVFEGMHIVGGDLDAHEQGEALSKPTITGDVVAHYEQHTPGLRAIVFCADLRQAAAQAEAFRAKGWRFEVIHGAMEDADRDRLIYGLEDGSVQGLVSVSIIEEGTDIPAAEVAILVRRTESERLFLQQVGRVLRPVYAPGFDLDTLDGRLAAIEASGKRFGWIVDHVGNCGMMTPRGFLPKHGLPHEDRAWSLHGRKKRAKKAAEETVQTRQCPNCYAVHEPAPKCPSCGHEYKVRAGAGPEFVDASLVEIKDEGLADLEAARAAARRAQANARTVDELVAQGMTRGRAAHILEARAEKERLQDQLRDLLTRWAEGDGRTVFKAWGFMLSDVPRMKPKQLKETIERVTEEILVRELGAPANDNGLVLRRSG